MNNKQGNTLIIGIDFECISRRNPISWQTWHAKVVPIKLHTDCPVSIKKKRTTVGPPTKRHWVTFRRWAENGPRWQAGRVICTFIIQQDVAV